MASGIFIVPLLTIVAGLDIHVAVGASIVSVIACSCGSAAPFLKERFTNVRLAIVLETATTLGAASGVVLFGVVPVPILYAIFAAVLMVSAWQMLIRRQIVAIPADRGAATRWARKLDAIYPDRALGVDVAYRVDRLWASQPDVWSRPALRTTWHRQWRLEDTGDGRRASAADQGFVSDVELHDRSDGRCERRCLLHARRDRARDR